MTRQETFAPTPASERVRGLDALRGLALLLILIANMPAFNSPIYYLQSAGFEWWTSRGDRIFETLEATFVQSESFALFSFLFGLGLAMQLIRAQRAGVSFLPIYVRRLLTLVVIGLFHAFFIWTGDILALYGALGFPLLLFRNLKPKLILTFAIIFYFVAPVRWEISLLQAVGRHGSTAVETQPTSGISPEQEEARRQVANSVAAYRDGDWMDATRQRVTDYVYYLKHNQAPTVFPLFLFGLYCGRRGIFDGLANRLRLFKRLAVGSFLVAVLGTIVMRLLYLQGIPMWAVLLRPVAYAVEHAALVAFYMSAVILLSTKVSMDRWTEPFAAAGRLALSNYLLQSVLCTLIFYGYGLRLYGKVSPVQGLIVVAGVFAVELYASVLWCKRFRFGPVEWLFRGITYGHLQRFTQRDA